MYKFLIFLILAFSAIFVVARPVEYIDNLKDVEIQKIMLDHQIIVKQAIVALDFSVDQKSVLTDILKTTTDDIMKIKTEKEQAIKLYNDTSIKLREDLYINNGITDTVKQCVKNADCKFMKLENEFVEKYKKNIIEVWQLLNPAQKGYFRKGIGGDKLPLSDHENELISLTILNRYALYILKPDTDKPATDDVIPNAIKSNLTDISLLNLLNVLYLTPDQSKELMNILQAAKKDYDKLHQDNIKYSEKYKAFMELLVVNPEILKKDAATIAKYTDMNKENAIIDADYKTADAIYTKKIKAILTDNQIRTIANLTPIVNISSSESVKILSIMENIMNNDTDKRMVSYLTSGNLIPLLQARIDGDFTAPAPKKL